MTTKKTAARSLTDVKAHNLKAIANFVYENGGATKREIQEGTSLSWGSVSSGANELERIGIFSQVESGRPSKHGMASTVYQMKGDHAFSIGLDVLRPVTTGVLLNLRREVVYSETIPFADVKKDAFLQKLFALVDSLFAQAEARNASIMSIGASVQGQVDSQKGISRYIAEFEEGEWKDVPLKDMLENRYHVPVILGHDTQCALYSERKFVDADNALLIRLGLGLGMAISVDGKILDGDGRYELSILAKSEDPKDRTLGDAVSLHGIAEKAKVPYQEILNHPSQYQSYFDSLSATLGKTLYNLHCLFRFDKVIFTGILADHPEVYLKQTKGEFDRLAHRPLSEEVGFIVSQNSSAAMGAGMLAADKFIGHYLLEAVKKQ